MKMLSIATIAVITSSASTNAIISADSAHEAPRCIFTHDVDTTGPNSKPTIRFTCQVLNYDAPLTPENYVPEIFADEIEDTADNPVSLSEARRECAEICFELGGEELDFDY